MTGQAEEKTAVTSNTPLAARLERFLEEHRRGFRRRDQFRWAVIYLQGLLQARGRKTVENITRAVTDDSTQAEDVAQALGHFLASSPWDEGLLWHLHKQKLALSLGEGGLVVLEELAFLKQGRHSVGAQRQYSRALGCKTNCQLAVLLHHLGPKGHFPLGFRLYLPRAWVDDEQRLSAAGVPADRRSFQSKEEVGIDLLDEALAAGLRPTTVVAGPGWPESEDLLAAARERGLVCRAEVPVEWQQILQAGRARMLDELGLDHFEGRSWRGLHHHACLVMLAHVFLSEPGLDLTE